MGRQSDQHFPHVSQEIVMPQIGTFIQQADGFFGRIHTFTHRCDIAIEPAEPSDADNAPDYRIHLSDGDGQDLGPEIGAGWKRTGERAGSFVALVIDDPALAQPLRATLLRDGADSASWSLHWSRPHKREARD
jgi:uncharacterized protein (DUF736 family)